MSLKRNFHGRRVEGGAAVNDDEFVQKQQVASASPVTFEHNAMLDAVKLLFENNETALEVLGIVRNGTINIEAIDALLRLKGAFGYEETIDENGFSFFRNIIRLLSVDDERISTILDWFIHDGRAIYFPQVANEWTDGDVRITASGRFEEYNDSGVWVPLGAAAGLSEYKGYWDASSNTPVLASGVGTEGDYYQVDVPGNTVLDGNSQWGIDDILFFKNGVWFKIDNSGATPGQAAAGVTGSIQINVNGAIASREGLVVDLEKNILKFNRFGLYASVLLTQLRPGTLEYDGTDLYFTFADLVRRKMPIRLTANKVFFGGSSNEVTEIATTDVYGASTAIKTFLDTEVNWLDGSGYPKASVFPGGGEVGQKHRNTNYIFECVALGEWVRYVLPAGYIDVYGVPSAAKILLETPANWTGKVYTGTALTGCFQGMKHFDNNYFFEFVALNTPIRTERV